jgi:hypothetical protein
MLAVVTPATSCDLRIDLIVAPVISSHEQNVCVGDLGWFSHTLFPYCSRRSTTLERERLFCLG